MRYFLRLAYNGAPYHGWQRQPNACSVQQTIEEALSTILRTDTPIVGAGRTDTGVNAAEMFAHFDAESPIADPVRLLNSLNRMCGRDIAITDLIPVHADAHARFDATERTYKYFVTLHKTPFFHQLSWHSPSILDVERMNEAATLLLGRQDFTSFAKLHTDVKTNICDVREAYWEFAGPENSALVFTISADRFLRNMVRAVVGTLVDVGRGSMNIPAFKDIINIKDRCAAGTSMPPQALYLWRVKYPYLTSESIYRP